MNTRFLEISDANELAAFFGMSYDELARIIYGLSDSHKYSEFEIPKKAGGSRLIKAPCKRLKAIQRMLAEAFSEVYSPRPSAHGFLKDRSIVTNARAHVGKGKTFVFNVDLRDYFGSIHFGRVQHLLQAWPFNFEESVASILAQICCLQNSLPQGAPTSPIVANMVSWKLDRQLQLLARASRATYTRYADDISFSFSCSKSRLPADILKLEEGVVMPGIALTELIESNGFRINYEKVRLAGTSNRMEVTGLTVNVFPNVPRRYVRQIGSILHAWRTHGYDAAQAAFNQYDTRHRPSGRLKPLAKVVWGKLAFLRSVRGQDDAVFRKLAMQYNELDGSDWPHIYVPEQLSPLQRAVDSLWVIESGGEDPDQLSTQGSGFVLTGVGLVTCAHCVIDRDGNPLPELKAYRCTNWSQTFPLEVTAADWTRDMAICQPKPARGAEPSSSELSLSDLTVVRGLQLKMLGFPDHHVAEAHSTVDAKVSRLFVRFGVSCFGIDKQIAQGNSGGPLIDNAGNVVGMAVRGSEEDEDPINGAITHAAIRTFVEEVAASGAN